MVDSGLAAPHPLARMEIRLLGSFGLALDGRPVKVSVGAQRLVALLALRGRTGRSRLAGILWPETTEVRALASLRTGIWRVNQAAPGLIASMHGAVELAGGPDIDVQRLIALSHVFLEGRPGGGHEAFDTPSGELLADWEDPWLEQERERLRQLRLHVLEAEAMRLSEFGEFGLAMELALAALRADDLRESAHRLVIGIHLAEGNVVEARRAFVQCRLTLRAELGVDPSPLVTELLAGAEQRGRDLDRGSEPSPILHGAPGVGW